MCTERVVDMEYATRINTFVADMVKKSVTLCQKMKESLSSSEEQAEQVCVVGAGCELRLNICCALI